MRWDQLDLANGSWTKPASATMQARLHRIPLSAPARQVLVEIKQAAEEKVAKYRRDPPAWVFPARYGGGPLTDIQHGWPAIRRTAGITDLHVHDLRHAYATFLASAGLSLPIIGRLLGHSQAATTNRYSNLQLDPLRATTDRVGAILSAAKIGFAGRRHRTSEKGQTAGIKRRAALGPRPGPGGAGDGARPRAGASTGERRRRSAADLRALDV